MGRLRKLMGPRRFHAHETARMDALNHVPLASFKRRAMALGLDLVLWWVLRKLLHLEMEGENHAAPGTMGWFLIEAAHTVEHLLESTIYFAVALRLGKGQTVGKWLAGVKVVSLTHGEIGWWQSIERGLGYGASLLEGGFGFLQFFINRNRQTVHDRIAETIVVDWKAMRAEGLALPVSRAHAAVEPRREAMPAPAHESSGGAAARDVVESSDAEPAVAVRLE